MACGWANEVCRFLGMFSCVMASLGTALCGAYQALVGGLLLRGFSRMAMMDIEGSLAE